MRSKTALLPAFQNVAVGGTASTRLPRNFRYHGIFLQYKTNAAQGVIEADIDEVRVLVNGRVIRRFSAAQLNLILALNGVAFQAGMIPIWFTEPWRATPEGSELLALLAYEDLGVGDVDIEVDINGAAVAPTLTGVMSYDRQRPADQLARPELRTVMHWLRKTDACGAAFPVNAPLTPAAYFPAVQGWLHRIHAFDAVVTQMILRNGATPFWNLTGTQLPALLNPYGMAKQAATFHVVLDNDQQYGDGFPIQTAPNLEVDIVTSGAAGGAVLTTIMELRKQLDLA